MVSPKVQRQSSFASNRGYGWERPVPPGPPIMGEQPPLQKASLGSFATLELSGPFTTDSPRKAFNEQPHTRRAL
jgi:hypothetical protein